MHETMPDDGEGREAGLAFLAQARALLAGSPGLDGATLAGLLERCQALAAGDDPVVAADAAVVELRLLGAVLIAQAAELRSAAASLDAVARWLPPGQVGQN